jgi:hypothetical protein
LRHNAKNYIGSIEFLIIREISMESTVTPILNRPRFCALISRTLNQYGPVAAKAALWIGSAYGAAEFLPSAIPVLVECGLNPSVKKPTIQYGIPIGLFLGIATGFAYSMHNASVAASVANRQQTLDQRELAAFRAAAERPPQATTISPPVARHSLQ